MIRRPSPPRPQRLALAVASIVVGLLANGAGLAASSRLEIVMGVDERGESTPLWNEILERRLGDGAANWSGSTRELTVGEAAWAQLIRSRLDAWRGATLPLAALFEPASPPEHVAIVLGNRGASDAFTHDPETVGFDLSELQKAYGDASGEENGARIDRLFRHEYVHLMQKSWMRDHPWDASTPQRAAILGIWLEGMGNYFSMSERWRARAGTLPQTSIDTLEKLEPRFVSRLAALACASSEEAEALTADLSQGPFDRKWGGLTLALWLERDASRDPEAIRRLILAGPEGVWTMAERHLAPPLAAALQEARVSAEICAPRG